MSTHPFIPLYVDDYDAATAHLTPAQDGIYGRLMRICWRTPGCALPNDEAWIARKCRVSSAEWTRVGKPVLAEFFKLQRGRYIQKRLKAEYDDISRKKSVRVAAGKKGGAAKALKTHEKPASIATVLPADTRAFPEPYPEPDKSPPSPPGGKKARRSPEQPIPDGYPDAEAMALAEGMRREAGAVIDVGGQAQRFRNHAEQNERLCRNWSAAWRNWILGAIERAPTGSAPPLASMLTARQEQAWMEDWLESPAAWKVYERGPKPGQEGCRVSAEVQIRFGVQPYGPPPEVGGMLLPFPQQGRSAA